jgi:hypothetical protein
MIARHARTVWFLALVAAAGCSQSGSKDPFSSKRSSTAGDPIGGVPEDTGIVSMEISLPTAQTIEAFAWKVQGPSDAGPIVQSGVVNVANSAAVRFLIASLGAASGYVIAVNGATTDGGVTCSGLATFDVAPRTTTQVSVAIPCFAATSGAHVDLANGGGFNCAAISSVSANPDTAAVGGSVLLTSAAAGADPAALRYQWSAPSGTFDTPRAASAHFTCAASGVIPVTMTVADGPVPAGYACSPSLSSKTINVTCTPAPMLGLLPPQGPRAAQAVPSAPPWAVTMLAVGLMGLGAAAAGRARRLSRRRA